MKTNISRINENKENNTKKSEGEGYPVDPHKICALEADQKKIRDEFHEYKHIVRNFEYVKK